MDTTVDPVREARFEEALRAIVLAEAGSLPCTVFLFGSRARKAVRRSSDFDIGVEGLSGLEFDSLRRRISDAVEESHIPHDVDIVNFDHAGEPFRSEARRNIVIWKTA